MNERVKFKDLEKYYTKNREFQGIPGIEISPSGRLWVTWYSGGVGEGSENYVVLVTSDDDGLSWSEPVAVVDPSGSIRAFDPTLWVGPDGVLRWFWSEADSRNNCISDGVDGVWFSECSDIESSSPEWSQPVRVANGVMMNKPMVASNGDWLLPTALWRDKIGGVEALEELKSECFSNVTVSVDGGKTFSLRGGADVANRVYDEHHIVELKDGRLWCLVRTAYGIGHSFSSDSGLTWSKEDSLVFEGPSSRFFIRRLSSGNLLMVYNNPCKENRVVRENLTAWISKDDGRSWVGGLLLDERCEVSYPDGCQDKDGYIRIIYDHSRYKSGDILMAKFTEDEVLAGKLVSEGSRLKQLVNSTGGVLSKITK